MVNIFITGGAGYVGSTLVKFLLNSSDNFKLTVLDNLTFGGDSLISFMGDKNFNFIKGDIRDASLVNKLCEKADIIIHLAAIVGFPACRKNPALAEEVNVNGSVNILGGVKRKDQLIICASTGSNYGDLIKEICTENSPLNPLSIYGVTKTKAETLFHESGKAICYRFATAFGLSPRLRLDLLINDFVYNAVKKKNLIIYEKHFYRTFIHVHDMARSIYFAIVNSKKMIGNIYNVGSEKMNFTKQQIAEKIKSKINFYLHFAEIGEDPDKRNYFVSYKKINDLGFETEINIDLGIDELIKGMELINLSSKYYNV
jgi:nucleoside-diphosphate-sugar epimerase